MIELGIARVDGLELVLFFQKPLLVFRQRLTQTNQKGLCLFNMKRNKFSCVKVPVIKPVSGQRRSRRKNHQRVRPQSEAISD